MRLLISLLIIGVVFATTTNARSYKALTRSKRAWVYPSLKIYEDVPGEPVNPNGDELGKVKSDNNLIESYQLRTEVGEEHMFKIDKDGTLYKLVPLDRETKPVYKVWVMGLGKDGNVVEKEIEYEIILGDMNDNPPIFVQSSLIGEVQEDIRSDQPFHKIEATDADSSYKANNRIFYKKINGSEVPSGNRFRVDGYGQVYAIGDLDAENEPRITFEVQAQDKWNVDMKTNQLKETATVTINILDANDHAPVFLGDAPYEVSVSELTPVGKQFFTIEATDGDKGLNSEVTFEFKNGNDRFRIESIPSGSGKSLGKVYVNSELDFEKQPHSYTFEIKAYNKHATNADDHRYQAETTITITVTDENEKPVFLDTPYKATLVEGLTINKTIGRVSAIDEDFGGQEVTYSLENKENWFEIDANGQIDTTHPVDREHPSVVDGVYTLQVKATDTMNESAFEEYLITITDINDNAPAAIGGGWDVSICDSYTDEERDQVLTVISAADADGPDNSSPFKFSFLPNSKFMIESDGNRSATVLPKVEHYDIGDTYEEVVNIQDTPREAGVRAQTGTATLKIKVCRCDESRLPTCSAAIVSSNGQIPIIIGVIVFIVLLLIIILAAMSYQRKRNADIQKRGLLYDEDDVRENLQAYHDEGGGEEDNDIYDMRILTQVDPNLPLHIDQKPLKAEPQSRPLMPPNSNIEEYIDNAKKQADTDPSAPPFDSLLVFDYEGQGSDAGSLSSIASRTTEGSQDYDYLNDWGPRFNKIADIYGGNESE